MVIILKRKKEKQNFFFSLFDHILSEISTLHYPLSRASQVVLVVKNLPPNAGDIRDAVRSLGPEDPLEEGMATYSSILDWIIPWTEEPGRLLSMGLQSQTQLKWPSIHTHLLSSHWGIGKYENLTTFVVVLRTPRLNYDSLYTHTQIQTHTHLLKKKKPTVTRLQLDNLNFFPLSTQYCFLFF